MLLLLVLLAVTLALTWRLLTAPYSYWARKGVVSLPTRPLVGSLGGVLFLREHHSEFFQRAYLRFKHLPFFGLYQLRSPALVVCDPELIKNILVRDFGHFVDHGLGFNERGDPMQSRNLFNMEGQRWKEMRAKLSPTFTSGRMKAMFPLVLETARRFEQHLATLADTEQHLDIRDLLARYSTDVIASCAFGVKCDSISDPSIHFRAMGRRIIEAENFIQGLKLTMVFLTPKLARALGIGTEKPEVTAYFSRMVRDVMAERTRTGAARRDFLQLLMELRDTGRLHAEPEDLAELDYSELQNDNRITDLDVTAQALVFFLAGFETSSSALTFALFELAHQPELQRKARAHIEEVLARHGGHVTYQALQDMTYLDWILQESLRMYPPVPVLNRVCNKNYTLPGTEVTLKKGDLITIPIHALQNDSKFFPDPETFEPERFRDPSPTTQYVFMPFGEGPRQCIGMRFARIQSKLGLLAVLRRLEVRPSSRSPRPLAWDPRQFLMVAKDTVHVKLATAA